MGDDEKRSGTDRRATKERRSGTDVIGDPIRIEEPNAVNKSKD
jgi:hypothetical protein